MTLGICKFCGEERPLIDAHIVPECFLDKLKDEGGPPIYVANDVMSRPTRLPVGFYDPNILCRDCDNGFSVWEDYSAGLLYRNNDVYERSAQAGRDKLETFVIGPFDYSKLRLCLLSIMWRMSISSSPLCKSFSLGPFEGDILEMLKRKDAGEPEKFNMALFRLYGAMASRSMQGPIRRRADRSPINFVLLFFPGYGVLIQVDQRRITALPDPITLAPTQPLTVGLHEFRDLFENAKPTAFAAMRRRGKKL
jgi:hypothetical protein